MEDVEMASIAEEEDLDEKFSHQGTSTVSGKKKIVRDFVNLEAWNIYSFDPYLDPRKL